MMVFSIILLTISFLLQGVLSNFLAYISGGISILSTFYVLITLLILSPYFEGNRKKFIVLLIIFGGLIDLVYCNTFLLNIGIFYVVYKFSAVFHFFLPYNLVTINVSNLLGVFIYHILSFILLSLFRFGNYSIMMLVRMLGCSVIMTIVYTTISYFVVNIVRDKKELKEIK